MKMVVKALHNENILQIKNFYDSDGRLPKEFICFTEYDDIDILDIVDDLENGGKKAVINQTKVDAKALAVAAEIQAEADAKIAKFTPLLALKAELLALTSADLTDLTSVANAILKLRDGMAAIEKELWDIDVV